MEAKIAKEKLGVVFPSGIIHRETSEQFTALFHAVLAAPVSAVVISFVNVKALLSDGIRMLVVMCDQTKKAGKNFYITDLSKEVKYTLQITNLLTALAYNPALANIMHELGVAESDFQPVEAVIVPESGIHKTKTAVNNASGIMPSNAMHSVNPPLSPSASVSHQSLKHALPQTKLSEEDMKKVIKSHVPGRLALAIVKAVVHFNKDVFSVEEVKSRLRGEKEEDFKKQFKRLLSRGTVMAIGGGMYNYGVSKDIRRDINALIAAEESRDTHSFVVKLLLDAEHF